MQFSSSSFKVLRIMADVEVNMKKLLCRIASEQGFNDFKFKIAPLLNSGNNYTSELYTANLDSNQNALNLFVKVAILSVEALAKMGITVKVSIYERERFFYSEVSKIFSDIEEKHNVAQEDRYVLPKYYGVSMESFKEMLVLEDLSAKGFTTYDRFKSIDWPYASAAVKELAKFHALSMAFEIEYPEINEKFIDKYNFDSYHNENAFKLMFVPNFRISMEVVKEENKVKLKNFLDNITSAEIIKMFQPVTNKVLIHTDYRPSNLMYRSREDGTIQVIPIDYQTYQKSCPVIDLMNFVFAGSDEEFRRQHFHQLMEHYYTELSAAMTRLGIDKGRYSRSDFDYDLKKKLKYGLVLAASVLPAITMDLKEAPTVKGDLSKFAQFKPNEQLVKRLNGVVDDFVRWGIL